MRSLIFILCVPALLVAQVGVWTQASATVQPPHEEQHVVYDPVRQVVSIVGGQVLQNGSSPLQLWDYGGTTWINQTPAGTPVVDSVRATFHSGLGRIVALADISNSVLQLFEWTGTTWSVLPGTPPLLRKKFGLTYDPVRDRLILFGGIRSGLAMSETWEWDGAIWQQLSSGGPTGRINPAMVYDSVRNVTVLFGGRREPSTLDYGDTWEWNGSYWFEHFGIAGPSPRSGAAAAFDTQRGVMVIHGGLGPMTDTWEWNGISWQQVQTPTNPGSSYLATMAFDSLAARMILSWQSATWQYTSVSPVTSSFTPFGSGCGGASPAPVLGAAASSLPVIGSTFSALLSGLPAGPFNIPIGFTGFDATSWNGIPLPVALGPLGFTNCQAWIAPSFTETLVNNAGVAAWDIVIPFSANVVGFEFFLQGGVLSPSSNPGGFLFTNAGHAVVGTQ